VTTQEIKQLAPRLGATFDVKGDGRMKAFASWGRYYDWTKYEIARGSFGGDLWHIFYRSLDTLDLGSLNLSNMPGQDLWGGPLGFRDFRATAIENTDPNIKPMYQNSFNAGLDTQLNATTMLGVHVVHNDLGRTIEDIGGVVINGNNQYVIGNPGEGQNIVYAASFPDVSPNFNMPKATRTYDAGVMTLARFFRVSRYARANYTYSGSMGTMRGRRIQMRSARPRPSYHAQQGAPLHVPAAIRTWPGTQTSFCGTLCNLMYWGVPPPIDRTS
jgi:hypothetical protein